MTVRPDLTFVVPTKNSIRTIERCLLDLRSQEGLDVEVIVIDNGSDDGTAEVAERLADRFETRGPERSSQRNRGLELASADLVAFIDSDMYLTPRVGAEARTLIERDGLDAIVIPEISVGEGFLADCRALEKSLYVGDADVEAARVFRADRVRSIGGYREDLRAGEDWDLSDRYLATGASVGRTGAVIVHDDGRVSLRDMFHKKRYYGQSFADYLRTRGEESERRLARPAILRRPGRLLRRPVHAVGLVLLKVVEVTGLTVGVIETRRAS